MSEIVARLQDKKKTKEFADSQVAGQVGNMRILVTGGAGFVGSHTCKALAGAGYEPVCYDNLSTGHKHAVRWGPLEVGDIRDAQRLCEVIRKYQPELTMHFAARAYVGESVRAPLDYFDVNVGGTIALLQCTTQAGINKIVFSSSCAVYGTPARLPITEDTPQNPINPYGFSKYAGERMLADLEVANGTRWIALRYFNAAGADPDGELGEEHDPETHAIPLAIQAALKQEASFTVYGQDYPTRDGSAVRDYVHVTDLAQAHVRAAAHLMQRGKSGAFNLGTGAGTSVLEIIAAVAAATGKPVPVISGTRRPGDPAALYASAEKACATLGWNPRFSSIAATVATAVRWMQRDAKHTAPEGAVVA
jgi:UDP-arabinose 4-epimerase